MTVHPGRRTRRGTLAAQLLSSGRRGRSRAAGIVHRLDRDTSGCSSSPARAGVRGPAGGDPQREVERRYLALVRGEPRSRSGRIDAPSAAIAAIRRGGRSTRTSRAMP
jgi:23S rRNA-/tRNA-specific pseudouridylate synthase